MAYDNWFCNDPHQMTILRGDVFMADVSLVVGSEQGGVRPVLVLQNDVGNLFSPTVIVAVLSSKPRKRQQTHVSLTAEECGLGEDSTVFLEQIKTIDKWRLGNKCTTLSPELMEQVDNALGVSVGLLEIPISFNPETLTIRRRDVFLADLSPVVGSEQAGVCPVLIIQNDVGNKYSPTVIVAVISDKSRKWQPTHVSLGASESGLDNDSIVFLEQIRSIDKARLGDKCTTLSLKHMEKIDYALGISVGLRETPTKRNKYVDHG